MRANNALSLYREEYKGKQRDPCLWAGGKYGDIISLEGIETLDHIRARLGGSVLEAYGWPGNLSDVGILKRLLALTGEGGMNGFIRISNDFLQPRELHQYS